MIGGLQDIEIRLGGLLALIGATEIVTKAVTIELHYLLLEVVERGLFLQQLGLGDIALALEGE